MFPKQEICSVMRKSVVCGVLTKMCDVLTQICGVLRRNVMLQE